VQKFSLPSGFIEISTEILYLEISNIGMRTGYKPSHMWRFGSCGMLHWRVAW